MLSSGRLLVGVSPYHTYDYFKLTQAHKFKYDLDRSTIYPMFELTGVQTHGIQIMSAEHESTSHVTEMLLLITWPSVTCWPCIYVTHFHSLFTHMTYWYSCFHFT